MNTYFHPDYRTTLDRMGPSQNRKILRRAFFLPMEIIMKEIAVKSEGVLPKRAQQIRPKRFTCVYVDNDSVF